MTLGIIQGGPKELTLTGLSRFRGDYLGGVRRAGLGQIVGSDLFRFKHFHCFQVIARKNKTVLLQLLIFDQPGSFLQLAYSVGEDSSVTFEGSPNDVNGVTVIVQGSGFGSVPEVDDSAGAPDGTGDDFTPGTLEFNTQTFEAGYPGNAVGLIIDNYHDSLVEFQFGSALSGDPYTLNVGDSYGIAVSGAGSTGRSA